MNTKRKHITEKPKEINHFKYHAIEGWLVDTIAHTLNVPKKQINTHTSFYNFGFDSLHIQSLLASCEEQFAIKLEDNIIYECENIKELAKYLAAIVPNNKINKIENTHPDKASNIIHLKKPVHTKSKDYRAYADFNCFGPYKELQERLATYKIKELGNIFFDKHDGIAKDTSIIAGKSVINFSSYNYLGLSGEPKVSEFAMQAIKHYGTSVSASRLVSGEKLIHGELETEIKNLIGTEDCVVFTTGHATNVNTISHLFGPGDLILHDELAHNSIVQGAIFSGATRIIFPHNDWHAVDNILKQNRSAFKRVLIVIEGVYSMDGDIPDVPSFIKVKEKHYALLMVDEAHSIGVLGKTGGGIREHFNIDPKSLDIWMGTLSKALASCGGYIAGNKALIEYLKYTCPGFVFSCGIPAANAAASIAAIRLFKAEPERIHQLNKLAKIAYETALSYNFNIGLNAATPVLPIIIGNSNKCIELSYALLQHGINIKPIIYPAVPENLARLRIFLTVDHNPEQIKEALKILHDLGK